MTLKATLPMLEDVGFQPLVFEDFHEIFVGLVETIINASDDATNDAEVASRTLLEHLQKPEGIFHSLYFGLINLNMNFLCQSPIL
jgi:hypothetical protein